MSVTPHSPFSPTSPKELKEKKNIEHLPKSYSEQFFWALKGEEMQKEKVVLEDLPKKV